MNATNLKSGVEVQEIEISESELSELNVFDPGEIDSFDAIEGEDEHESPTGEISETDSGWVDGNGNPCDPPLTGDEVIFDDGEIEISEDDSTPPASDGDAADDPKGEGGEPVEEKSEPENPEPETIVVDPSNPISPLSAFDQIQSMQSIVQEISETEFGIEQTKAAAKELKARRDSLHLELRGMVMDFRSGQKRLEFGNSDRPREPKEAGVVAAGTTIHQEKVELIPVGVDGDGNVSPIDDQSPTEPKSDPAEITPFPVLCEFGLTESQCEKWTEADIDTIADLEKAMNEDRLGKIVKNTKGLGPASIDKVVDALLKWRAVNPA